MVSFLHGTKLLAVMFSLTTDAFTLRGQYTRPSFALHQKSGGRAPHAPDKIDSDETWDVTSTSAIPTQARLIVIQVTDVYTLENFASLKTLVEETKQKNQDARVVCMLTGDFLSPYLLSSVDKGKGMMNALAKVPMDYLTWGNHEADIDHPTVCRHVRNFPGKWINSNMLDHEAMDAQQEYDVIELCSPDGSNTRKVGLVAVLSNDPDLYSHFKEPGAFGGATLTDPWEALAKYKEILENEESCDMVIPLQHLYVPDDHRTCQEFDFPVILSGHDHHRVDEVICGTRLLKPGMNAEYATVLECCWQDSSVTQPSIRARFVRTQDWAPDPVLEEENSRAYDALMPLRNTELAPIPAAFRPLSSNGSREGVCTMGRLICTLIRSSMNLSRRQRRHKVDAVMLMGGNIRGNTDYADDSFFSLEALEAEIKSDEVIAVVPMPGWLLAQAISETHAGDPIPGWMQYDIGIQEDTTQVPSIITHVANQPLDKDRIYRVATKISDLTNGQSPSLTDYYTKYPQLLPPKGAYVNIHAELMSYFARNLWRKLWDAISEQLEDTCCLTPGGCNPEERLKLLDSDGSGVVTVEEIQTALRDFLGISVDEREMSVAKFVHSFADTTGNGRVTLKDFQNFCADVNEENELPIDHGRLAEESPAKIIMEVMAKEQSTTNEEDLIVAS